MNQLSAGAVERPTSWLRTTTAAFVAAFGLVGVLLGGMLPCGVVHAADVNIVFARDLDVRNYGMIGSLWDAQT